MSCWMVSGSLLKPGEIDFRRRIANYKMPTRLCRFPGGVGWMLLNHQTGASVVCTHRELKRGDVVCVLYGASLPVVPRKRHGRVLLERGMHMFKRIVKGHTQSQRTESALPERRTGILSW